MSHFPIVYGFKFERESGRDFSLELCEFILALEDMITTFTTLSYFHYGDITVPRHCGKCLHISTWQVQEKRRMIHLVISQRLLTEL